MNFDMLNHKYSSKRSLNFGKNGMVATSHPYASQAGLEILKKGGNAIDAAIATAAALTVVEPTANGIGGDAFAIVWFKNKLHGLNSSGFAPEKLTIEELEKKGYSSIPEFGVIPVTVPGVPAAWAELSKKFGKLTLLECLEPAIKYAKEGIPIFPSIGKGWKRSIKRYISSKEDPVFEEWFKVFSKDFKAPEIGDVWKLPDHGDTLEKIGKSYAKDFYEGEISWKIDAFFKKYGGYLTRDDLMRYKPEWVEPISTNYRGYDVWEIPPNGQGIVTLMALNILSNYEPGEKEDVETIHKHFESIKLAFADGKNYISEPEFMKVKIEELLDKEYAKNRSLLIKESAGEINIGNPGKGGTVYLTTADGEGNMVSYIQSNYMGFGSGVVIPGTGIAMQNRGNNFSFDKDSPNALAPNKRPYHTIIPGFITKDNEAIASFGVMGGFIQPQAHLQVITNLIDFNLNPQDALDAPRWQWIKEKEFTVEDSLPNYLVNQLAEKGHTITKQYDSITFGRGQIILRTPTGVLIGGTESRTDGTVVSF